MPVAYYALFPEFDPALSSRPLDKVVRGKENSPTNRVDNYTEGDEKVLLDSSKNC